MRSVGNGFVETAAAVEIVAAVGIAAAVEIVAAVGVLGPAIDVEEGIGVGQGCYSAQLALVP